ncbi:hypothetical protein ASPCAL14867 [Aspergillus calidoustus]|uniref:Uncharacterized protein n=1 Tax=Aspergillus calidoustus TaxID=454130 RepID=A0A0U5CKJ5_ASPCI|nr:hypothetical protein ASPCAL14867 [Aspergillus calidoustus]
MSDITRQIDIGQLSFQSLTAVAPLLSAITADDVAPMAAVQLERLGAAFPISGEMARKVPDYLQRFNSTKLDRFGLLIGWRKGDCASFMANSLGGQSIALLMTCLKNIYPNDHGRILADLSERVLGPGFAVSSPAQLARAADAITPKLGCLGFGNVLARNATRVYDAYRHIGSSQPRDLLTVPSRESIVEILFGISRALQQEDCIVRVSGKTYLGYIHGLVMMLFPDDAMISVDNYIIHEGVRRSIVLEFRDVFFLPISTPRVRTEDVLDYSKMLLDIPLTTSTESRRGPRIGHLRWEGWIANQLRLEFLARGLKCPDALLLACCNLLVLIPECVMPRRDEDQGKLGSDIHYTIGGYELPKNGLTYLLGSYPRHRMLETCQTVFEVPPFEWPGTLGTAMSELITTFISHVASGRGCLCAKIQTTLRRPNTAWGDASPHCGDPACTFYHLWKAVGRALDDGLVSFFVQAGPDATVTITRRQPPSGLVTRYLTGCLSDPDCYDFWSFIWTNVSGVISETRPLQRILAWSGSSTLYPATLRQLELDLDRGVHYEFVDGQLQHKGHSYKSLIASPGSRSKHSMPSPMYQSRDIEVRPNSFGAHSRLTFTVNPPSTTTTMDELHLTCEARCAGQNIAVDLAKVIVGSYGVVLAEPCAHSKDDVLEPVIRAGTACSTVACPIASFNELSIVQVARNSPRNFCRVS